MCKVCSDGFSRVPVFHQQLFYISHFKVQGGILGCHRHVLIIQQLPTGLMQDLTQSKPSDPLSSSSWFLPVETGTGAHLPSVTCCSLKPHCDHRCGGWGHLHIGLIETSDGLRCVRNDSCVLHEHFPHLSFISNEIHMNGEFGDESFPQAPAFLSAAF